METASTSNSSHTAKTAFGPQFILFDVEADWARTTLVKQLHRPANWNATGYDYLTGERFVRLEVFEKPTERGRVGRAEALGPEAFRHIPIRYRMKYVIVARGLTLSAPEHWSGAPGPEARNGISIATPASPRPQL